MCCCPVSLASLCRFISGFCFSKQENESMKTLDARCITPNLLNFLIAGGVVSESAIILNHHSHQQQHRSNQEPLSEQQSELIRLLSRCALQSSLLTTAKLAVDPDWTFINTMHCIIYACLHEAQALCAEGNIIPVHLHSPTAVVRYRPINRLPSRSAPLYRRRSSLPRALSPLQSVSPSSAAAAAAVTSGFGAASQLPLRPQTPSKSAVTPSKSEDRSRANEHRTLALERRSKTLSHELVMLPMSQKTSVSGIQAELGAARNRLRQLRSQIESLRTKSSISSVMSSDHEIWVQAARQAAYELKELQNAKLGDVVNHFELPSSILPLDGDDFMSQ